MNLTTWTQLKKYHYELFLKNLSVLQAIHVLRKKMLSPGASFQSLEIGVTYACQLDCVHCGVTGQRTNNEEELSTDEIIRIINDFDHCNGYFIVFAGAEPLLRKDIFTLIQYASKKGVIPALSTNGLLLSEDVVCKLKKVHTAFLNISLDSADVMVHDNHRNHNGCYDAVIQAFAHCKKHGLSALVSTYATKENLANGDLAAIIKLARTIGARGVRILIVVPAGKLAGCSNMYFTDEENMQLRKLLDPTFVYIEGVCNTFTECNSLLKKLFFVSPYGDVQPCSFVPLRLGNIRKNPLREIIPSMKKHLFFNSYEAHDCIMRNLDIQKRFFSDPFKKEMQDI